MRSLRVQLILWTILPLTLVLIGLAYTGVRSHQQTMQDLVLERDRMLAEVYAARIEELLHQREQVLFNLSRRAPTEEEFADWQDWFDGGLAIYSPRGKMQRGAQGNAPSAAGTWLFIPDATTWQPRLPYLEVLLDETVEQLPAGVNYSPLFQDDALHDRALMMAIPAATTPGAGMGRAGNSAAGVVSFTELGLSEIFSTTVGERGMAYLTTETGEMLIAPHAAHDEICGAAITTERTCQTSSGEKHAVTHANIAAVHWHVVVEEPWEDVTSADLRYSQAIPLVLFIALVVTALAIGFSWQFVMRPLQSLGKQTARVAWGDYDALAQPVGGVQEIRDLQWTLQEMARRLRDYQTGMQDYLAAVTRGQESERRRLARELHDDTTQALIAQNQRIQLTQRAVAKEDIAHAQELLAELRVLTQSTIAGVRRFTQALRPLYLEDLGLVPSLEMLVKGINEDVRAEMRVVGAPRRLPAELELTAFRVAQEALNNVKQHARAAQVTLTATFTDTELTLAIADDGGGFGVPDRAEMLAHEGHFGLMGMRERVLLAGGQLTVNSAPNEGTTVVAVLPI